MLQEQCVTIYPKVISRVEIMIIISIYVIGNFNLICELVFLQTENCIMAWQLSALQIAMQ